MKKQKSISNLTETLIKKPPKLTLLEIEKISNHTFKTNYFPDNQYDNYMNLIMEVLVFNKNCHLVTIFKDFMILDYVDEFLKRYYRNSESKDRIPRFANFYKNYLKFFCKPTFSDFECNEIIQEHSEKRRNYIIIKISEKKIKIMKMMMDYLKMKVIQIVFKFQNQKLKKLFLIKLLKNKLMKLV